MLWSTKLKTPRKWTEVEASVLADALSTFGHCKTSSNTILELDTLQETQAHEGKRKKEGKRRDEEEREK